MIAELLRRLPVQFPPFVLYQHGVIRAKRLVRTHAYLSLVPEHLLNHLEIVLREKRVVIVDDVRDLDLVPVVERLVEDRRAVLRLHEWRLDARVRR